ncbi:MAG: formylglycine-generating enzyme family protein [Cytophagales bacterium]|nr:MAG: formylglycine-generating enzyme family protein [Cytophagales bacterium]
MKKTLLFLLLGILHWQVARSQTDTDSSSYTVTVNGVSFKMIKVKGGSFQMGSDLGGDELLHTVTLTDYYIAETEVTQALWRAVMGTNPSENKNCDECPVTNVSWNDIVNGFFPKLEQLTGKKYRLPTEAEWEYAARGGQKSKGYTYAGSNDLNQVAWYWENSGDARLSGEWNSDKIKANNCKTHPVKTKAPNELGLYDMSGNVWEWCQDWYGAKFYSSIEATKTNPVNNNTASGRVLRGGSWYSDSEFCHSTIRYGYTPSNYNNSLGFRFLP